MRSAAWSPLRIWFSQLYRFSEPITPRLSVTSVDLLIPVIFFAAFPFIEWGIHVALLHWKPRRIAGLKVDPLVIDPDRLPPLALFAVEAITNAQKHAFAARGGVLKLEFTVRGEEAELAISDDGQTSDAALLSSGVGRTLMTAFARQLRGRAELVRNRSGGVTARLIFPTRAADSAPPSRGNQAAA